MLHAKLLQRQVTLKKRPAVSPQPRVSARLQPALVSSYSIRNQVHYVKSTTFSLYKTQNDLGSFARGRFQLVKYSTSQELIPPQTEPHRTKLTVSERWRLTKERFQKKKLQFTVEYGSTFIFLHELLGISSYLTVFSLIHFNVINVDTILGLFGWDEAYLMERFGIDAHGLFTKWALTIATVKVHLQSC